MIKFLKENYQAYIIGGIISILLANLLVKVGLIIVTADDISPLTLFIINSLSFIACWLLVSFLIYKFSTYEVVGVLALLIGAAIVETFMKVQINPITILLLILFWLGVAYLIVPQFFKKYRIAILSIYGLIVSYFLIFRLLPNYTMADHQNFLRLLVLPVPILLALWIYEQWRWLKMLQIDKAKAELALLKNQINPHFFFNTLNNLYGLAVEKSEQAPAMILKLSDMMRYSIYEGKEDFVPLKNEVSYLEDYIDLHKIRYQKKVEISVDAKLQHAHPIAPLLLGVPLENAFKHGVESLAGHAFIKLEISTSPTTIFFQISNNYESSAKVGGGIGLSNLKKRLALIYPKQHKLEIIQTADTYTLRLSINPHELSDHR